jgi:hypothetical protein
MTLESLQPPLLPLDGDGGRLQLLRMKLAQLEASAAAVRMEIAKCEFDQLANASSAANANAEPGSSASSGDSEGSGGPVHKSIRTGGDADGLGGDGLEGRRFGDASVSVRTRTQGPFGRSHETEGVEGTEAGMAAPLSLVELPDPRRGRGGDQVRGRRAYIRKSLSGTPVYNHVRLVGGTLYYCSSKVLPAVSMFKQATLIESPPPGHLACVHGHPRQRLWRRAAAPL